MRLILLVFTLLFSLSVAADCCNYEIETSINQCMAFDTDHQDDNCDDSSQHSEAQHCHCSPINHFKITSQNKIVMTAPYSIRTEIIPNLESLLISNFESTIFHPPIV